MIGGWGTEKEIFGLSGEESRSRLIVEMEKMSFYSVTDLEKFPTLSDTKSLVGFAYISVLLRSKGILTQNQLEFMEYEAQRNTLIEELNKNMFCFDIYSIRSLQDLDDISLYNKGVRLKGILYIKKQQMHICYK